MWVPFRCPHGRPAQPRPHSRLAQLSASRPVQLRTKPIYGELLERYVRAQGMQMAIASHVGSGIMELPLEMGAIADGKRVRDVRWPSGCLIIGLRRGESEIVPRGDTRLRAGDYLVVLFSGEEEREVRPAMRRLCDARLD